jgi:hypothetical protein
MRTRYPDSTPFNQTALHSQKERQAYLDRVGLLAKLRLVSRRFNKATTKWFVIDVWLREPSQMVSFLEHWAGSFSWSRRVRRLKIDVTILRGQTTVSSLDLWPTDHEYSTTALLSLPNEANAQLINQVWMIKNDLYIYQHFFP